MARNLLQFLNSSHYREITLSKMRNLLQIHDRSLSWPGAGTSIKNGRVKLVLWAQRTTVLKKKKKKERKLAKIKHLLVYCS
jgi:hypothetical protein